MSLTVIDKQVTYDADFGVTLPFMSPAAGALVKIRKANGGVLAQLYSQKNGGVLLNNPFTLGADARILCYVESGSYDIEVTRDNETVVYSDYQAVDDLIIRGPSGQLTFSTVADLISGSAINAPLPVNFADYVGQKISTVYNNTTSKAGGAEYVIKTLAQADTDGDTVDGYANHYLVTTDYIAVLIGQYTVSSCGTLNNGSDDSAAIAAADALGRVVFDSTHTIGSNLTISSPVEFIGNSVLTVTATTSLTINAITAPRRQIFSVASGGLVNLNREESYAEWFGSNNSSDSSAVNEAVRSTKHLKLYGDTDFDSAVVITKPIKIEGQSVASEITVPSSGSVPAFDLGPTGGSDRRKIVMTGMNFSGGNGQCIQASGTNPLDLSDMRFDTGKEALKLDTFYYGVCRDAIFFKSGVDMNNVNNFDFLGTDANGNNAVSSGRYLATDYAFTLNNCIGIQFSQMTFEVWDCNILRFTNCKSILFHRSWFEANDSERLALFIDTGNITFSGGGQIDTSLAQPSDCLFQVANTSPSGARELKTAITFSEQYLVLSQSPTSSVPFVKTSDIAGSEKANVTLKDCTLRAGFIHNPNLNTEIYVYRMMLSSLTDTTDTKKGFTAMDTVDVSAGKQTSWCPDNVNAQWDFTTGTGGWVRAAGIAATISVATSTPASAPKLTGTNVLKIATTSTGTLNMNLPMTDAGAITNIGETYFIAVKVWSTAPCSAKLRLLDNNSIARDDSTTVMIGSNQWRWLVMKTNSANMAPILASGIAPILRIDFVTSTNPTDIYIDRADFQIDKGDHYLP